MKTNSNLYQDLYNPFKMNKSSNKLSQKDYLKKYLISDDKLKKKKKKSKDKNGKRIVSM